MEWICGVEPGVDMARHIRRAGEVEEFRFTKTRPDDFIRELQHIDQALSSGTESPIDAQWGVETMLAIATAHRSHAEGSPVGIAASHGWTLHDIS